MDFELTGGGVRQPVRDLGAGLTSLSLRVYDEKNSTFTAITGLRGNGSCCATGDYGKPL
ncbi:hypothetical protein VNF293_00450 [Atlantibacter hermannii]